MVTFEKFRKQPTQTVIGTVATQLEVGDIVKFKPSVGAIVKFDANVSADETYADIQTAIAGGYEIYVVAQGDNITYKIPTDYKEYDINRSVATSNVAKPVVCYRVKNASNVIISDDELTAGYAITFAGGDNYTVTAKKNNNSITSGTKVDGNDTVVFTITPASGYQIASVTNNGTTVTSSVVIDTGVTNVGTYTLTSISAAVTLAVTVEAIVVSSIAITTQPTKTTYTAGETFDPTGMVVTATYSDTHTAAVTTYTYSPDGELATTDTTVTVTFEEKTATVSITVNE